MNSLLQSCDKTTHKHIYSVAHKKQQRTLLYDIKATTNQNI